MLNAFPHAAQNPFTQEARVPPAAGRGEPLALMSRLHYSLKLRSSAWNPPPPHFGNCLWAENWGRCRLASFLSCTVCCLVSAKSCLMYFVQSSDCLRQGKLHSIYFFTGKGRGWQGNVIFPTCPSIFFDFVVVYNNCVSVL